MEMLILIDNMLCHGGWFLLALFLAGFAVWLLKRHDKLDWLITFCYRIAPLIVVAFCCWFFVHAFEVTHRYSATSCNCLQLAEMERISTDTNLNFQLIAKVDSLTRKVNEKIANISTVEHDRFRAELGTWLSVFGLLSIIATIVVPVATYKAHSKDLEGKVQELEGKMKGLLKK